MQITINSNNVTPNESLKQKTRDTNEQAARNNH